VRAVSDVNDEWPSGFLLESVAMDVCGCLDNTPKSRSLLTTLGKIGDPAMARDMKLVCWSAWDIHGARSLVGATAKVDVRSRAKAGSAIRHGTRERATRR
jgi:hypothetical protein